MKKTDTEKLAHPVKLANVNSDDLMAFVYFAKVRGKNGTNLDVSNVDEDMKFSVMGQDLIERGYSADQFSETHKITKTRAAEILISSYNRPFTVCFDKQEGEERVLRGRLVHPEPLLGRSKVEDLDLPKDKHRMRLVDHRTIKYLIVEGVKYVVK